MPLYLAFHSTCVYLNICRTCKLCFLMYVFLLRLVNGGGGGSIEMVNNSTYLLLLHHFPERIGGYFPVGPARRFLYDDAG